MPLKDRVIIVTGGANGIGKATAMALADQGANLIIADLDGDGATDVAELARSRGVSSHPFAVDVSKAEQVEAMVDFAVETLGTLNGIFNNAGTTSMAPFLEMSPELYHHVVGVNQHGVYHGMYYAAKKMVALGARGTFVNTSSIYGAMVGNDGFNYHVAKAAVDMMTKSAALELAEHGIRVVGVAPGFVNTRILGEDEWMKASLGKMHMRERLIEPEQVASVVAFLFSEEAEAINGHTIPVDDGYLLFKRVKPYRPLAGRRKG